MSCKTSITFEAACCHAGRNTALCLAIVVAMLAFFGQADAAEEKPIWLVVGRPQLVSALDPLAAKRRAEGFETIVSTASVEEALESAPRRPAFLLLVGDDEAGKEKEPWYLAAKRRDLYRWRHVQRRDFASDAAWGDVDGNLVPEIPVGRIPARSTAEVEMVVKKTLDFERRQPTVQDLRVAAWCGSPGYGTAVDTIAIGFLLSVVRTNVPPWIEARMIISDAKHPLCGWPPDQPSLFTTMIRQGGICHIMAGHADADRFYSMKHVDGHIWYRAADAAEELRDGQPAAPLVVFSCESGYFDRPSPSMAESLLFFPAGPVATIAATTESHPLTNYYTATSLLNAIEGRNSRIGAVWLKAQQDALTARNFLVEQVLRDVEGKLEDRINVQKLQRDQALMYVLLGDPATRLRIPARLEARVERLEAGWRWEAVRPDGATELHVDFRPATNDMPFQNMKEADREKMREAFQEANATFAFTALASHTESDSWSGTLGKPGWLRLCATGPDAIYAAVLKVR